MRGWREGAAVSLAFAVFAAAAGWMALRMPVFNSIDEPAHVDYALKLARVGRASPTAPMEEDLRALIERSVPRMNVVYRAKLPHQALTVPDYSYQAYQPPGFHWLAAGALRLLFALGLELEGAVLGLRLLCAAMLLAARVLTFLTLRRLGRPLALAALPYLAVFVPPDLLRVSNDTLVMLLGALAFWALLRPGALGPARGAGLAALLSAAVLAKLTALLFLLPALAALALLRGPLRSADVRALALLALPPLAVGALWVLPTWLGSGDTGPPAGGFARGARPGGWLDLLPSAASWLRWHQAFFFFGTPLARLQGDALYPLQHFVTLQQLGSLAALGALGFGAARLRQPPFREGREGEGGALGRLVLGSALGIFLVQAIARVAHQSVGAVSWYTSRHYASLELPVLLPALVGWLLLLAAAPRRFGLAPALALGAALLFGTATLRYLVAFA